MKFTTIFEQGLVQETLNSWKKRLTTEFQDPDRIQNRMLSRSGSNLLIRILLWFIATSNENFNKKITRSIRILNWLIRWRFDQGPVQNFSRISVSNLWKIISLLIRILIRKHKDSVWIFAGEWLSYPALFISGKNLTRSFWIRNLMDPAKFDRTFSVRFFYVSVQIFLLSWEIQILPGFTLNSIQNPDKKIGNDLIKIWSGFSQYPSRILCGTIQE